MKFTCPSCHKPLVLSSSTHMVCESNHSYTCEDGIWRMLAPERIETFEQFIQEYEVVREAEGRGSNDPGYYQSLPWVDKSGKMTFKEWKYMISRLNK